MAYTRGNLAVKERTAERSYQSPRYRETTKVVTRRTSLPVREKLLYIMTVIFCVAVMAGLLWQNANLYNIKRQLYNLNSEIQTMTLEVKELTVQKERLEESIPSEAAKLGYVKPDMDMFQIEVPATSDAGGTSEDMTTARK
ncbi:hypothetical protein [Paenibacillus antibioticophila]|uniref:hypothetical protein n=1 Tax=Paenibacillus antibioticophila TaxID=1274374 RepID=UPI0005CA8A76|nr:hypothetical protein [Paenibacillus antibioticophila]